MCLLTLPPSSWLVFDEAKGPRTRRGLIADNIGSHGWEFIGTKVVLLLNTGCVKLSIAPNRGDPENIVAKG